MLRTIVLPGGDEIMRRLATVNDSPWNAEHFYPLIAAVADRERTGVDLSALFESTIASASGGGSLATTMRFDVPAWLLALIDDPQVLADALVAFHLRALTVRWPHVAAIVFPVPDGCVAKRTENRTHPVSYRGPVAIHAGKAWDPRSTVSLAQRFWENSGGLKGIDFEAASGAILAVADLTGCHQTDGACCHPWGETSTGVWHWQLENVQPLDEPVPCRGQLGLWRPTADVVERVPAQIVLDGGAL